MKSLYAIVAADFLTVLAQKHEKTFLNLRFPNAVYFRGTDEEVVLQELLPAWFLHYTLTPRPLDRKNTYLSRNNAGCVKNILTQEREAGQKGVS